MFKKPRRNFVGSYYKPQIVIGRYNLSFGSYGFIGLAPSFFTKRQMESVRLLVTRVIKRRRFIKGRFTKQRGWMKFNVLYNISLTKKGSKSRMGKGKGSISSYVYRLNVNQCFLELKDVPLVVCYNLLRKVSHKLGVPIALVSTQKQCFVTN